MRKKVVAGNWKMNCNRDEAFNLASEISGMVADEKLNNNLVILAPPFVHLAAVSRLVSGTEIKIAAQNCSGEMNGAFTGEVSAPMIKSVGADFVIIGHSERRSLFNESNELLVKKVGMALDSGLDVIFCIGEQLKERESDKHFEVISDQLNRGLFQLINSQMKHVIIAYEPVWAIGTGITASPGQAQEMHSFIRSQVGAIYGNAFADDISILYGGSCNENNAAELFALPDVDGGLIGGASLKSRSFVNIIKSF